MNRAKGKAKQKSRRAKANARCDCRRKNMREYLSIISVRMAAEVICYQSINETPETKLTTHAYAKEVYFRSAMRQRSSYFESARKLAIAADKAGKSAICVVNETSDESAEKAPSYLVTICHQLQYDLECSDG